MELASPSTPVGTTFAEEEPSDDVAAMFARNDIDSSGGIDVGELHEALRELGLDADVDQTRAVMIKYDTDRSGTLELAEFRKLVAEATDPTVTVGRLVEEPATPVAPTAPAAPKPVTSELSESEMREKLMAVFIEFDTDGSGEVSIEEMAAMTESLGLSVSDEELAAMMNEADEDDSGQIGFEEFLVVMQKQMAAGGAASGGLGGIFSAKAGSMFSWFDDMTTPFKGALDSIVSATPLRLFAAPSAAPAAAPAAAAASTKGRDGPAPPGRFPGPTGLWSHATGRYRPHPFKAATPTRFDLMQVQRPKGPAFVPPSRFKTEGDAKRFFGAPRAVTGTASHSFFVSANQRSPPRSTGMRVGSQRIVPARV